MSSNNMECSLKYAYASHINVFICILFGVKHKAKARISAPSYSAQPRDSREFIVALAHMHMHVKRYLMNFFAGMFARTMTRAHTTEHADDYNDDADGDELFRHSTPNGSFGAPWDKAANRH